MTKKKDRDILALEQSIKALNQSTSPKMLRANLEFLMDRYLKHPSKSLPKHLRERQ